MKRLVMNVKSFRLVLGFGSALAFTWFSGCRTASVEGVQLSAGGTEVVVAAEAPPVVHFAAAEMTNLLSQAFGTKIPLVDHPSGNKVSVVLGANEWSSAVGIDIDKLPRDAYRVKTCGKSIFIIGKDDDKFDPPAEIAAGRIRAHVNDGSHRGTLNGVYGFLENFAGVRFYFPGELGTVVPRAKSIRVSRCDFFSAPVLTVKRAVSSGSDGVWFEKTLASKDPTDNRNVPGKVLNWLRLRLESDRIPFGHGQNGFDIIGRFRDSHPEYLRIDKNGNRDFDCRESKSHPFYLTRQYCHTSDVWKEFYLDIASYFRGEPATNRKACREWGTDSPFHSKYVNIMPQDGMQECFCAKCQAAYDHSTPEYANELIWGRTLELADKLADDGFDAVLTMMSYRPYGMPPKVAVPTNVLVMVAVGGPWSKCVPEIREKQIAHVKAWYDKLGRKVSVWDYPGKFIDLARPDVPCLAPRAIAEYNHALLPYVDGIFSESGCDRFLFQYLNYCVFAKIAWEGRCDVEAFLGEHHRLMFGAAAMKMFYDRLEDIFITKIAVPSTIPETMIGPIRHKVPTDDEIFSEIYSAAVLKELEGYLDSAESSVGLDSIEARRIALMRRELFCPIAKRAREYQSERSVDPELERRAKSIAPFKAFEDATGWGGHGKAAIRPDAADFITAPDSLRFEAKRGFSSTRELPSGLLVPGKRYRLSFFMKADLKSQKDSAWDGATLEVNFGNGKFTRIPSIRGGYVYGKWNWTHWCGEFGVSADIGLKRKPYLELRVFSADGPVWVDAVRIEEVL